MVSEGKKHAKPKKRNAKQLSRMHPSSGGGQGRGVWGGRYQSRTDSSSYYIKAIVQGLREKIRVIKNTPSDILKKTAEKQ